MTLLLIEDDLPLADGLARALQQDGQAVEVAGTAGEACRLLDARAFDAVVLDLGLPDLDGSAVVEHLAKHRLDTPVLVLSARDGLDERIRLLDLGADDYLVKPAARDEFLARVRALLRRRRTAERLPLGRLQLDMDGRRAYLDDVPLDLNGREWALLTFLAANPGRVLARDEIAAALYAQEEAGVSDNAIEQILSRFRRRIADCGLKLRTVRGLGYYFEIENEPGGA